MKRTFVIEWPDECGPMWMNKDNLLSCLKSDEQVGPAIAIKVTDITENVDGMSKEDVVRAMRGESR